MIRMRNDMKAALLAGGASLVLLAGALVFQYGIGLPPCEICHWQRWPHIAAIVFGLGGGALLAANLVPARIGTWLAGLAILFVALSGALGVYHAGVEWRWWEGPSACTGTGFTPGAAFDFKPIPVTACDEAAWRFLGLSLAGYNAIISFVVAGAALYLLRRKP